MDWAKIKITPLNLIIALCFSYAIYCLLGLDYQNSNISNTIKIAYTLALSLILFFTDI